MTFIIGTFQSRKSKHNQVKWNKTTQDMCMSDSIFLITTSTLLKWLLKFFFLIKFIITGNWTHFTQKDSQPGSKINTIFRLS